MKEQIRGWVLGNLVLLALLFVMSQIVYQRSTRVFYVGFIEGEWIDVPAQKTPRR
jgi:hypothetical protein